MSAQTQIIDLATKLIGFKSTSLELQTCQTMLDFVEGHLADLPNVVVRRYESKGHPSLIATIGGIGNPQCFLYSHLDVVPADDKEFTPYIREDRLYGRGSGDMKGPAAAMIEAFRHFALANKGHSLGLMLTTDEEILGDNGAKYLLKNCEYTSEVVIIPDNGSDLATLITNQKGIFLTKIWAHGEGAHGSRPWLGDNAIDKLYLKINSLREQFPIDPLGTTINFSKISAGQQINQVPDYAEAHLDIRFASEAGRELVLQAIKTLFADNFEVVNQVDPFSIEQDDPWLNAFRTSIETTGTHTKLAIETGGSDARFFSTNGTSAIVCGVQKANTHGANEWASISEILKLYDATVHFVDTNIQCN